MVNKIKSRQRRLLRTRSQIKRQIRSAANTNNLCWLTAHRSNAHIYAQVIAADGRVLCAASSLQSAIRSQLTHTGSVEAAKLVGSTLGALAKKAGVAKVAFDRSGFKYHGRIKALAEAARGAGLEF